MPVSRKRQLLRALGLCVDAQDCSLPYLGTRKVRHSLDLEASTRGSWKFTPCLQALKAESA